MNASKEGEVRKVNGKIWRLYYEEQHLHRACSDDMFRGSITLSLELVAWLKGGGYVGALGKYPSSLQKDGNVNQWMRSTNGYFHDSDEEALKEKYG
jgi:hypothetical protein